MIDVLTYTQEDFDLLVALGMPDTQEPVDWTYNPDGGTEAIIMFCVSIEIAKNYLELLGGVRIPAFTPNRNEPGVTGGPLLDIGVDV